VFKEGPKADQHESLSWSFRRIEEHPSQIKRLAFPNIAAGLVDAPENTSLGPGVLAGPGTWLRSSKSFEQLITLSHQEPSPAETT